MTLQQENQNKWVSVARESAHEHILLDWTRCHLHKAITSVSKHAYAGSSGSESQYEVIDFGCLQLATLRILQRRHQQDFCHDFPFTPFQRCLLLLSRPSPAGGQWCPTPQCEICAPHFTFGPSGCCIHPIQYFKNVPPLLVFGPSFWFLAPLLLNLGDGPGCWSFWRHYL